MQLSSIVTLALVTAAAASDCTRSYGGCRYGFDSLKESCSRFGSSGTRHGDCVTHASRIFDDCISAVDHRRTFCWPSSGYHHQQYATYPPYARPAFYGGFMAADGDPQGSELSDEQPRTMGRNPSPPRMPPSTPPSMPSAMGGPRRAVVSITPDPTVPAGANVRGTVTFVHAAPNQRITIIGRLPADRRLRDRMETQIITIIADVTGLPPGLHGWHVHATGNIFPNCTAAGLHFNPFNRNHGAPDAAERHIGDFGNLQAAADGSFKTTLSDGVASLFGDNSIIGRALVLHAGVDDLGLTTNPLSKTVGNSGARLACGVIGYA
ncbi:hypothetical protein HK105_207598 [Polyrhizophydium stewartii]|uniref:Superoxide dismutase [Cu-Zn] n=1 Tax=Polyrhizophydium stewartii TaxID=2732419 RepID=A0ABR4N075_9FUNG